MRVHERTARISRGGLLVSWVATLALSACGGRTALDDGRRGASTGGAPTEPTGPRVCQDAVLDSDAYGGSHVAIADESAFWTTNDGRILRAPLAGGPAVAVVSDQTFLRAMAAGGGFVTFGLGEGVARVPVGGGPVELLASKETEALDLVVDGTDVFWLDGYTGVGRLMRWTPGEGAQVLVGGLGKPVTLRADATHVYFVLGAWKGSSASIRRVPRGGGDVEVLESSSNGVTALGLDAERLYWLEQVDEGTDHHGVLHARDKAGGSDVTLGEIPHATVVRLAIDDESAYVSAIPAPNQARLLRLPLAGGEATTLAELSDVVVGDIAVGDDAVVWTWSWNHFESKALPSVREICK